MTLPLVLAIIFAASSQACAFVSMRWGALLDRSLIVAPKTVPCSTSPATLNMWEQSRTVSPHQVPYFTLQRNHTITWGVGCCMEATERGDAIQLSHCTGKPTQFWTLLPGVQDGQNIVQLRGSNKCIGVSDKEGDLSGIPIELQKCEHTLEESWVFEVPNAIPAWGFSDRFLYMRHATISLLSMALLGVLSFAVWLRWWRKSLPLVVASQGGMHVTAVPAGVSLTSAIFNTNTRKTVPAVMLIDPTWAEASTISNNCRRTPLVRMTASSQSEEQDKPMRVKEMKALLNAAGISTDGVFEKEELLKLFQEYEASMSFWATAHTLFPVTGSSDVASPLMLPLVEIGGMGYVDVDVDERSGLRFLVDTGASYSFCTYTAGQQIGNISNSCVTLRSVGHAPGLELVCRVAPEETRLPPGVDGILGYDVLSAFKAIEFDWGVNVLRFHRESMTPSGTERIGAEVPISILQVSAGTLPFVRAIFGTAPPCEGLLDSGSPVTMLTPKLCEQAEDSMMELSSTNDILATGVDGQSVRMRATECDTVNLVGAREIVHDSARVFVGVCSMMEKVGWQDKATALIGLDLLRPKNGDGKTIFDWEHGLLRIE